MAKSKLAITYRPIDSLKDADYNPRKMTERQSAELRKSLETFGFVDPIIVNMHASRKDVVVGGHQRLRIAREIGLTEVPCLEVKLTEQEERELNIRLNRNLGEWDWEILAMQFDVGDLVGFGFEAWELGKTSVEMTNPDIEWEGMPEFEQPDKESYRKIIVHFRNDEDAAAFGKLLDQAVTEKTKYLWFPIAEEQAVADKRYAATANEEPQ